MKVSILIILTSFLVAGDIKITCEEHLFNLYPKNRDIRMHIFQLDKQIKNKVENIVKQRFYKDKLYYWTITEGDSTKAYAFLDNVIGKSMPITFMVILNIDGEIENVNVIKYREAYGLHEIPTLFRGTLRRKGFSQAWNIFVQLGMTDDSYKIEDSISISNREFTNMLLFSDDNLSVEDKFCKQFGLTKKSVIFKKMEWLGVFTDERMKIKDGSPAQILQEILERKWSLGSNDKDMIVMQHQFEYIQKGKQKKLNSSLLVIGDGPIYTAMAKTVGLPVAIATKLILNGSIKSVGVKIPITKDIYIPILKELEENRINFIEELV